VPLHTSHADDPIAAGRQARAARGSPASRSAQFLCNPLADQVGLGDAGGLGAASQCSRLLRLEPDSHDALVFGIEDRLVDLFELRLEIGEVVGVPEAGEVLDAVVARGDGPTDRAVAPDTRDSSLPQRSASFPPAELPRLLAKGRNRRQTEPGQYPESPYAIAREALVACTAWRNRARMSPGRGV